MTRHEAFRGVLALRIDVDFPRGLTRAVPFFLDRLAGANMQATFFVVAGSNTPRGSLARLASREYRHRLCRLGPRAVLTGLGSSLLGGGKFLDDSRHREVVRRIVDEGHEVAVHGLDHVWWADRVWSTGEAALADQIERAFDRVETVAGRGGLAWGAPSWRSTPSVLRMLEQRGVPYFAECWGTGPFLSPDDEGRVIDVPHLPVTLPSFESDPPVDRDEARERVSGLLDSRAADRFDVLCLHDYHEGLMRPWLFETLLDACDARGLRLIRLAEMARIVAGACPTLPVCALERRPLPGFAGPVSFQGHPRPAR